MFVEIYENFYCFQSKSLTWYIIIFVYLSVFLFTHVHMLYYWAK